MYKLLTPSSGMRDLALEALDEHGELKIMPASFYESTTAEERAVFGMKHGLYCLPTVELVEDLRKRIAGRSAIEIGAGTGVLAKALGIQATDSHMQSDPAIASHYAMLGQPTIRYGSQVAKLDAHSAVRQYQPQVVIAAWVTHLYDPGRHDAGGNMFGVDEMSVLQGCEEYIFVGNRAVHAGKSIWDVPHEIEEPSWLYSRALNGTPEFISSWRGKSARSIHGAQQ